ncbi:MAG TPA: (Fe-S)-binding protein [Actinomycetota bacterium]
MLTDRIPGGPEAPLGTELPDGARFIGPLPGAEPAWPIPTDAPTDADLSSCVACGLCLPHCPTYRLTGEESASPRGRIAAMREVHEGRAEVDATFARFMDLCLSCRACEDVCPSHVPFGRMMEHARVQIEPLRTRRVRAVRRLGLDVVLPRKALRWLASALQPLGRLVLPSRVRRLVPRRSELFGRLPRVTTPYGEEKGTVALLAGCVQDRWYRGVNRATIRVLARNGWRVVVPRGQTCCGALNAHYGRLGTARRLAEHNLRAFADVDVVVVNAAGCGAHLKDVGDLLDRDDARAFSAKVRDVMELLADAGVEPPPASAGVERVAYHDACHALRAQHLREEPRVVLRTIPGLEVVEVPDGDLCCGAAGLYNVLEPELSSELRRRKTESVSGTGADVVASANPGCTMQIAAGLRELGAEMPVVHPVELLDRAYSASQADSGRPA